MKRKRLEKVDEVEVSSEHSFNFQFSEKEEKKWRMKLQRRKMRKW